MKRLLNILVISITIFCFSYASVADVNSGLGKVTCIKKVGDVNYVPGKNTLKDTFVGMGGGALAGLTYGAIIEGGLLIASSPTIFGPVLVISATPIILGSTTLIGAIAGTIIGAGGGYVYDLHEKGLGVFEITVQPYKKGSKPITFDQNLKNSIQIGQKVHLVQDNVMWFIPVGYHINNVRAKTT